MMYLEKPTKTIELLNSFKDYYSENDDRSFYWLKNLLRHSFPSTLSDYNSFQLQLHEIWECSLYEPINFKSFFTSGTSSNKPRKYKFGPRPDQWITCLWELMVYQFGWRPIVNLRPNSPNKPRLWLKTKNHGLYQWQFEVYRFNNQDVLELIKFLDNFIKEYGYVTLAALPEAYLYLNQTPIFLDFAEKHRDRLNHLSWCWEPFFNNKSFKERGIWIGNHMVDWTSGLNFYTCRDGHQHVLPIFVETNHGPVNALNLFKQDLSDGGDKFEITNIIQCSCGLTRPVYTYYPHFNHSIRSADGRIFFDLDIANHLKSRYRSLQFIQKSEHEITIHYDVDGPMEDKEFLESIVQSYGFGVIWNSKSHTMSGRKQIPFFSLKGLS